MLTYAQLKDLKQKLDRLPDEQFFYTATQSCLFAYGLDKPVADAIHAVYREFFETFDPVLVKEMVRYITNLKKNHTYKRRNK